MFNWQANIDNIVMPMAVSREMFYFQIREHYSYDCYDFANTDKDVKLWFEDKDELSYTLKEILIRGYGISRYEEIRFLHFIRKSIQGTDLEQLVIY